MARSTHSPSVSVVDDSASRRNIATSHSHSRKPSYTATDPGRRHSLPLPSLFSRAWGANPAGPSLEESDAAARGETNIDEAVVARRISALRQLNGAAKSGHRYAKSTGARNSTYSQPVIVRTYSGNRPPSRQTEQKKNDWRTNKIELPPVEAFSFKGIMDSIQQNVAEDLERIAEICARSRYSLSNQYEVHMPPHGSGAEFLPTTGQSLQIAVPTLQAVPSDEEPPKTPGRPSRGVRRVKSAAYGTLETIMSSSRSSDEDKERKKSAADVVEEVRGRAMSKDFLPTVASVSNTSASSSNAARPARPKHNRSKSAGLASILLDSAQGHSSHVKTEPLTPITPTFISEPARPQTSIASDMSTMTGSKGPHLVDSTSLRSPSYRTFMARRPSLFSTASTLRNEQENHTLWSGLTSWLPWSQRSHTEAPNIPARLRSSSVAEGTLRQLLNSSTGSNDLKGKGIERGD